MACLVAALASWLMGGKFVHADDQHEVTIDFAQPEVGDAEGAVPDDVPESGVGVPASEVARR